MPSDHPSPVPPPEIPPVPETPEATDRARPAAEEVAGRPAEVDLGTADRVQARHGLREALHQEQPTAVPESVSAAAERFGLTDRPEAVRAVADAYQTVREQVAPFVVKAADAVIGQLRETVAANPNHKVVFLGRDGTSLGLAAKELDPTFHQDHCTDVVISRKLGESALRGLENFMGRDHRTADVRPGEPGTEPRLAEPYRWDPGEVDPLQESAETRESIRSLLSYLTERGLPLGRPDSALTVVDSSFKGTVQNMLATIYRGQARLDGVLMWHGDTGVDPYPGTKTGIVEEVGPGDRGNLQETVAYEHLMRGPLGSPSRFEDGRPQQRPETELTSYEGLDPARVSERYRDVGVRNAVRDAAQRAVADYAREIAGIADPVARQTKLATEAQRFSEQVGRWREGAADPTVRELFDSFVPPR